MPETFIASFPKNRDKLYLLAMTLKLLKLLKTINPINPTNPINPFKHSKHFIAFTHS